MIPGLNPAMIEYLVKAKLDEILNGELPSGFVERERTAEKIVLAPVEPEFVEGVPIVSLDVSVLYKGVLIMLIHGH